MQSLARRIDTGLQNFYASLKNGKHCSIRKEMQPAFACKLLRRDLFQLRAGAHSNHNLVIRADSPTVLGRPRTRHLPIQILISVALDFCGWDSPADNATVKPLRGRFAIFPGATGHGRDPGAKIISREFYRMTHSANSLSEAPRLRFERKLGLGKLPVNAKNYVLLPMSVG